MNGLFPKYHRKNFSPNPYFEKKILLTGENINLLNAGTQTEVFV